MRELSTRGMIGALVCSVRRLVEVVQGIPLKDVPDDDFETSSPIIRISVGCEGTSVVCHHKDGAETWFPSDMWLEGGFTPPSGDKKID